MKKEPLTIKSKAESPIEITEEASEKEHLLELYQELKDRNIRSIGDLEGQIARCK